MQEGAATMEDNRERLIRYLNDMWAVE